MKMKKLATTLAATAACLLGTGSALAAGVYDGIYQNTASPTNYISLHTSGNTVIATGYGITSASGISFNAGLGTIYPTQVNTWDLFQGTVTGNVMNVTGQQYFNGCSVGFNAVFTGNIATINFNFATPTSVGAANGVKCSLLTLQGTFIYQKIY